MGNVVAEPKETINVFHYWFWSRLVGTILPQVLFFLCLQASFRSLPGKEIVAVVGHK